MKSLPSGSRVFLRVALPAWFVLHALPAGALFAQDAFPGWERSLTRAAEIAAESKKPIFAVFRCVR